LSLEQLIKNCVKQNAEAQSQLYKQYASKLFSLCLKYSKNYAEAEDNLHDAFITVCVYDIVNESEIEDVSVDINDEDLNIDFLLKIIQDLPNRYRLIFNLYVLDGYSHVEISDLINISIGTSKSNLARARLILKQKIEDYKAKSNSQSI
jgi:DNA-directed RNA polymerase specialized sigma24 family protein